MKNKNILQDFLKDKDKAENLISRLYKEATAEELALLKSIGKFPLRLLKPYLKQEVFLKDKTHIRIVTGGNSSGKTLIGCAEFLSRIQKIHPYDKEWNNKKIPRHGLVLVEDTEQAKAHGASQSKILSMLDEDLLAQKPSFDKGFMTDVLFKDGSSFRVRSSKAGRKSMQGSRLDVIWIDEDCIKDADFFDELIFRISDSGQVPLIIYTYTPNLDNNKESFADDVLLPRIEAPDGTYDLKVHQFSIFDNPYIPDETKQFLLRNSAGGADQINARFDGDSKKKFGLIYNFKKDVHVIPPISKEYIKAHCKSIFRIIDPHPVKPTAVSFIGIFDDNRVIQFNELFQVGLIKDVATRIKTVCDGLGHLVKKTVIDYSANAKNAITGQTIVDEFLANNIACVNCIKDVTMGINFVRELLAYDEENSPTLFITSNCSNTIREFSKYREDAKTGLPIKKRDEFMDNIRYFACDLDAQFQFLKREKKNVRIQQRVINEGTTTNPTIDSDKARRVKARQLRNTNQVGRGVGRGR